MALRFHPEQGTIVICDFVGLKEPEMVKRRPAIIISPRIRHREMLCTVAPFSTTKPKKVMPYHFELVLAEPLPAPYNSKSQWVKGDMVYTVSLGRLHLPFDGKNADGKRNLVLRVIDGQDFENIKECVRKGLGLS